MSVPWAAIAQAGADIGSTAMTMFPNMNQAGISRDDMRYYTENAHSVEVADMRRAGLNPILSAL